MKTQTQNICQDPRCGHQKYPHHIELNGEVGECSYNLNFENQELDYKPCPCKKDEEDLKKAIDEGYFTPKKNDAHSQDEGGLVSPSAKAVKPFESVTSPDTQNPTLQQLHEDSLKLKNQSQDASNYPKSDEKFWKEVKKEQDALRDISLSDKIWQKKYMAKNDITEYLKVEDIKSAIQKLKKEIGKLEGGRRKDETGLGIWDYDVYKIINAIFGRRLTE